MNFIAILFIFSVILLLPSIAQAVNITPKIAVTYFLNTSEDPNLNPLSKGLSEMLITDLAVSKDITLVERERLNDLLDEIKLQENPYFDQASASQLGKGLGASYIITGSYLVMNEELRIDARLIDVDTSQIALSVKSQGKISTFFDVQKKLAADILSGLGASLTLLEQKKIGAANTTNFQAFSAYSKGLDLMDEGDTENALKSFEEAKKIDPNFVLAEEYLQQLQKKAGSVIAESKSQKEKALEDALAMSSQEIFSMEQCQELLSHIITFSQFAGKIYSKKTPEDTIKFEQQLGALHKTTFNLMTQKLDDQVCLSTRDAYLSMYISNIKILITPQLEYKKAKAMGQEGEITSAENRLNYVPKLNIRDENEEIIVSSEQLIPTFFQLAEVVLDREDIFSGMQQLQKEQMAIFVETYAPFLYEDTTKIVEERRKKLLVEWLKTGSRHFHIYVGEDYRTMVSPIEDSFQMEGNQSSDTIGFEIDWVWDHVEKIEGKWLHQEDFVELPRVDNYEEHRTYFCSDRCNKDWEGCDDGLPYGHISPESVALLKESDIERLETRNCKPSVYDGWLIHRNPNSFGPYVNHFYVDFSTLQDKSREELKTAFQFRITLKDGQSFVLSEIVYVK